MIDKYDVLVAGGGTAGVVAAIQSARAGARTLLVEKTGILGGTMTTAGVSFPGIFHAWGRQVIAGIGWELVTRTLSECGDPVPSFDPAPKEHWRSQIRVNPAVFAAICDETLLAANAGVLFHTMPASLRRQGRAWKVTLCTKAGLTPVMAQVLVDCTGDANLTRLGGGEVRMYEDTQPGTLICRVEGYDEKLLDLRAINRNLRVAVGSGIIHPTDVSWNADKPDVSRWLACHGENAGHICGISAEDSRGKTRLEIEGRRAFLRVYRFLRTQPGLESLRVTYLAPECGVRESVTIVGKKTVTLEDYVSGRLWENAICYSYYPIDLHKSSGGGLDYRPLAPGTVPTVPMGALVPRATRQMVVAGRCISSDRLANSALRVQATCMATGQAAGAMAAVSVKSGVEIQKLSAPPVRDLLRTHNAIIPEAS